jgi:hypothetical protein
VTILLGLLAQASAVQNFHPNNQDVRVFDAYRNCVLNSVDQLQSSQEPFETVWSASRSECRKYFEAAKLEMVIADMDDHPDVMSGDRKILSPEKVADELEQELHDDAARQFLAARSSEGE